MSSVEVLKRAKEILSRPRGWTRKAFARNTRGVPVNFEDDDACSFCLSGAIVRAGLELQNDCTDDALANVIGALGGPIYYDAIVRFNDDQKTVEPVLALLDKVIATEESK